MGTFLALFHGKVTLGEGSIGRTELGGRHYLTLVWAVDSCPDMSISGVSLALAHEGSARRLTL